MFGRVGAIEADDLVGAAIERLPRVLRRSRMPELMEERLASPNYNDRMPLPQPVSLRGIPMALPTVLTKARTLPASRLG